MSHTTDDTRGRNSDLYVARAPFRASPFYTRACCGVTLLCMEAPRVVESCKASTRPRWPLVSLINFITTGPPACHSQRPGHDVIPSADGGCSHVGCLKPGLGLWDSATQSLRCSSVCATAMLQHCSLPSWRRVCAKRPKIWPHAHTVSFTFLVKPMW